MRKGNKNVLTSSLHGGGGLNNTTVCLKGRIRTTMKSLRN